MTDTKRTAWGTYAARRNAASIASLPSLSVCVMFILTFVNYGSCPCDRTENRCTWFIRATLKTRRMIYVPWIPREMSRLVNWNIIWLNVIRIDYLHCDTALLSNRASSSTLSAAVLISCTSPCCGRHNLRQRNKNMTEPARAKITQKEISVFMFS